MTHTSFYWVFVFIMFVFYSHSYVCDWDRVKVFCNGCVNRILGTVNGCGNKQLSDFSGVGFFVSSITKYSD